MRRPISYKNFLRLVKNISVAIDKLQSEEFQTYDQHLRFVDSLRKRLDNFNCPSRISDVAQFWTEDPEYYFGVMLDLCQDVQNEIQEACLQIPSLVRSKRNRPSVKEARRKALEKREEDLRWVKIRAHKLAILKAYFINKRRGIA